LWSQKQKKQNDGTANSRCSEDADEAGQLIAEANNRLLKAMTSNNNGDMLTAQARLQSETSKRKLRTYKTKRKEVHIIGLCYEQN